MRGRWAYACLAVAVAVGLAGCAAKAADGGFVGGDGAFTRVPAAKRGAPVRLTGADLDGRDLDTQRFAGRVVVLNVWGSWCAPCRKEAPELARAAKDAPQAAFVGIDTRDLDPAPARAFVRSFAIGFPSFYDPEGRLLLRLAGDVPPNAIPSTLVLDKQGRVAARVMGAVGAATLTGIIHDLDQER